MNKSIVLQVENLSLIKNNHNILNDVSFRLPESCLASIIGPTGAGKTSIIRSVLNFEKNHSSIIKINGKKSTEMNLREVAKQVAYVHQNSFLPAGLKVYDYVLFARNPYLGFFGNYSQKDHQIVKESLLLVDSLQYSDRELISLSGGEQRLVIIARAIAQQTPIIILDEPAASLDFALSSKLTHILQNLAHHENKTVLVVTHDINNAMKFSDLIILLKNGSILIQGEPNTVITEDILQKLYGSHARLSEDSAGNKIAWASYQK